MTVVTEVIIVDVTATGTDQSTAALIPTHHGTTIVRTNGGGPSPGLLLPSDSDIGDVIEVYSDINGEVTIYCSTGDSFRSGISSHGQSQQTLIFRKLAANEWGP